MISLVLPLPPSANNFRRTFVLDGKVRQALTAEAKAYKARVAEIALARGYRGMMPGELSLSVRVYRARRAGDLDNFAKVLLDSFTGVVYADDSQVTRILMERFDDKANPRVEVEIRTVSPN